MALPNAALAQGLTILPTSQTVPIAGDSATYSVTVTNSTGTSQTFVPFVTGLVGAWTIQLPASVTVASEGSQPFNLVLTTPLNLGPGTIPFTVNVSTIEELTGSVGASISIANASPPATPAPPSLLLIWIGLAMVGLYAARNRLRRGSSTQG